MSNEKDDPGGRIAAYQEIVREAYESIQVLIPYNPPPSTLVNAFTTVLHHMLWRDDEMEFEDDGGTPIDTPVVPLRSVGGTRR
jgi:hypothetical protein